MKGWRAPINVILLGSVRLLAAIAITLGVVRTCLILHCWPTMQVAAALKTNSDLHQAVMLLRRYSAGGLQSRRILRPVTSCSFLRLASCCMDSAERCRATSPPAPPLAWPWHPACVCSRCPGRGRGHTRAAVAHDAQGLRVMGQPVLAALHRLQAGPVWEAGMHGVSGCGGAAQPRRRWRAGAAAGQGDHGR